jgi:pimeloyl-ACP methyl ester carboxylesterase
MPLVAAAGVQLHVQEIGPAPPAEAIDRPSPRSEGSTAPLVVMVHGLLVGSLASWLFTAAPTLARTRRVRVYDLRGHGRSERARSGYDTRTLAGDLGALCGDEPQIDLVGHSWGGLVALRFALDHPGRVRKLAVVEAPLPPASASQIFGATADPRALVDALPAPLRDAVSSGRRQAARLVASLDFLARETTLLADLAAEPDFDDAELARLQPPLLAVYGDRSACRSAGDRLARVVPGATLRVLAGGHYLHLDARAELAAALDDFLHG